MDRQACTIRGVEKAFGPNRVLRGIDLDLAPGHVTVLMGANGAGKSTLVKILCGVHAADAGTVTLFGRAYAPATPAAAMAAGIVTVHQSIDDGVIPDLDVASNLMLDRLAAPGAPLFVRRRALRAEAARLAATMGLALDMAAPVASLGLADRQIIAIARAMGRAPKVLILDEPTSSLSATEAERLFALLDRLRDTGVAILYISHRMSDIRRIADRIVTMRDGAIAGTFDPGAGGTLDIEAAVTSMLGHSMTGVDIAPAAAGAPVLRATGLRLKPGAPPFDLTLHEGEVVAVTGLLGSGKSALAEVLFGLAPAPGGAIALDGAPYAPRTPGQAIAAGVFLCARDRAANGVVRAFDIRRNLTLPFLRRHSRGPFTRPAAEAATADATIERLGIVCQSDREAITALSGGNQQKVMVGRWLAQPCRLLLLDEPFQGVDIRARRDIGARIRATAAGRATLVLVAELDEALEIADRILVLHEHALAGEHRAGAVALDALLAQITGSATGATGATGAAA